MDTTVYISNKKAINLIVSIYHILEEDVITSRNISKGFGRFLSTNTWVMANLWQMPMAMAKLLLPLPIKSNNSNNNWLFNPKPPVFMANLGIGKLWN